MKTMSFDFHSRRSMVTARRGMVATSNPLASQAGLEMLRAGGSAADAAVAAAAVLAVTEPASTGLGGDCFVLYYDRATRRVSALNGSGRAPADLHLEDLLADGMTEIPEASPHAVTVPGAVRAWADLLERHGRMTLKETLAAASEYARDGFAVQPVFAASWQASEIALRSWPGTQDYLPGGRAPATGQVVRLPQLAATLTAIAEGGAAAFYTGKVAEAIVATLSRLGGRMTLADLQEHTSTWGEPIQTSYRGVTVMEHPPSGQGLAALQALNIVEGFDLAEMPWGEPERLHVMIEAMRLAFADARHFIADPAKHDVPVEGLLDKAYATERRALIDREQAMQPPTYGRPSQSSNTVYLCAVDGEGNACSLINSLFYGWGSGIVAEGTGVFLQNRGSGFSLNPEAPNALAPRKRPYHTIIPALALKDDELYASFGVMGGYMQPQGHLQVISALVDDELNPQEALNRPRFCLEAGTSDSMLALEEGIPVSTMAALAAMGHPVRPVSGKGRGVFGDGHIILRDAVSGVLFGGSDPRKDGQVAAY